MPRIRQVKVHPFNSTQDIPEDQYLIIHPRYPGDDFERALDEDNHVDPSGDTSTNEFFHMVEAGAPVVAACMFTGATECAHIDATVFAHRFNGTLPENWGNAYKLADWPAWERYHEENGRQCPSCETFNYDTRPGWKCGNCLGELPYMKGDSVDWFQPYGADNDPDGDGEFVYGTVVDVNFEDKNIPEDDYWITVELDADSKDHGINGVMEIRKSYLED